MEQALTPRLEEARKGKRTVYFVDGSHFVHRGLLWIPAGKLAQSERQIIGGMLKKQFLVSVEKALDKRLDFSMHFEISPVKEPRFIGYSDFRTFASDVCSPLCRKSWS